jgi:hypothetical protein
MCEAKAAASALHHNCGIRIREFGAHQRRAALVLLAAGTRSRLSADSTRYFAN